MAKEIRLELFARRRRERGDAPDSMTRPKEASPIRITADSPGFSPENVWTSRERRESRRMMATTCRVPADRAPNSFFSGSSSGNNPYLMDRRKRYAHPSEKRRRAMASTFSRTRRFPVQLPLHPHEARQCQQHHEDFKNLHGRWSSSVCCDGPRGNHPPWKTE